MNKSQNKLKPYKTHEYIFNGEKLNLKPRVTISPHKKKTCKIGRKK